MGFDESLFQQQPIRDEYKCPICHDVLDDPYTITTCDHVFCSFCIKTWLGIPVEQSTSNNGSNQQPLPPPRRVGSSNRCPVCQQEVQNKQTDLKQSLRVFRQVLDTLRLKCSYKDCRVITVLSSFRTHLDACLHNPINAPFNCPKFCGAEIRRNEEHECLKFLSNKVSQLQIILSRQTDQLGTLQEENRMHLEDLDAIQDSNRQLTNENDLFKMELESSRDENRQLRRQNQTLTDERVMLQVMNEQLTEEVKQRDETVDNRTVERENHYRMANEENRKLAAELERKSAQYDILKQKLARLTEEKRVTDERLDSVTEQYNLLDMAHERLMELYEGQNKLLELQEQIKQGQSD